MNDRDTLRELLHGVRSHVHVLPALEGLAPRLAGAEVRGSPHTIFQILGHMIYWQDISLERLLGRNPPDPATAAEGWVFPAAPADDGDWEAAVAAFADGLRSFDELVADPERDLDAVVHQRRRRSTRDEVLMLQGHNSYHLGQVVLLRQQLGAWPPPKGGDTW